MFRCTEKRVRIAIAVAAVMAAGVVGWLFLRRSDVRSRRALPADGARLSVAEIVEGSSPRDDTKQGGRDCGVRSLALVLELAGKSKSLEEVRRVVPVADSGSSLADLERASGLLGHPMQAVMCRPDALSRLSLPAIAQVEPTDRYSMRHYVVLLNVGDDSIVVCDASKEQIIEFSREGFLGVVTGYYLAPQRAPLGGFVIVLWCAGGILAGIVVLRWRWKGANKA